MDQQTFRVRLRDFLQAHPGIGWVTAYEAVGSECEGFLEALEVMPSGPPMPKWTEADRLFLTQTKILAD